MNNWIDQQIRVSSRNRLLAALLVLAVVALVLYSHTQYLSNYFKGPRAISATELAAVTNPETMDNNWVTLTAEQVADAGFQEITVRKKHGVERSRSVTAHYYVAVLDEKLLLVRSPTENPGTALKGELRAFNDFDSQFFDDPEAQKLRESFYPFVLDMDDYESSGNLWLWIGGLLAVAALVYGAIGLQRMRDPGKHPAAQQAGDENARSFLSQQIESQLAQSTTVKLDRGAHLTTEYLVLRSLLNFSLLKLSDVLWAYQEVTQKKLYYVIPAGKSYALALKCLNEKSNVTIATKEAQAQAALALLAQYQPGVIIGFSDEIQKRYKSKKTREELAAQVAQARAEPLSAPPSTPAA